MANRNIFVVVPTIRENSILRFLDEWKTYFQKNRVSVILIEDNPAPTFAIPKEDPGYKLYHYTWQDMDRDLGENSWIISRRSSANKSYGFWKAYGMGADMIVALDDDCYPAAKYEQSGAYAYDPIRKHEENLFELEATEPAWVSSTKDAVRPRGLPYGNVSRKVAPEEILLSHGLWANVPDLDATTQIAMAGKSVHINDYHREFVIPRYSFFPMSGMNLAWKRELTPAMHFMLMGQNREGASWGYDRFDDIWAGIFAKKIIDTLNKRAISGHPVIWHDRASNPEVNLQKEKSGLPKNERLWEIVDSMDLRKDSVASMYLQIAENLSKEQDPYWQKLAAAMKIWAGLFSA